MSPQTADRSASKAEAVEAAKELFWRKGYAETSMAELVEATGMNRYALYSVFGSKREVFLAALEVYFEEGRERYEPLMRDRSVPPLERVSACLEAMAQQMREQQNGCLICHVAAEHRSDDPLVAAAVASYFEKIREADRDSADRGGRGRLAQSGFDAPGCRSTGLRRQDEHGGSCPRRRRSRHDRAYSRRHHGRPQGARDGNRLIP